MTFDYSRMEHTGLNSSVETWYALPEVISEGETDEEALANAEEAIRATISYRQDHGIAIPADAIPEVRRVTVAA